MGLPADYYPLVMRVIDLIGQGRTQTSACDECGITVSTFKSYVKQTPELHIVAADAEQRGYDTLAEILLEIDRHEHYGSSDPKQQKVISDNIKWLLSRKRPQQYGERIVVENHITADKAIIDALSRGRDRAMSAKIVEGVTYSVVEQIGQQVINTDDLPADLLEFV